MESAEAETDGEELPHGKVRVEDDEGEREDGGHEGTHVGDEVEDERDEAEEEDQIDVEHEQNHRRAHCHDQRHDAVDLVCVVCHVRRVSCRV